MIKGTKDDLTTEMLQRISEYHTIKE